jgi:hypothetical protein
MWQAVRKLTGRTQRSNDVTGFTTDLLSQHCASLSDDPGYLPPALKLRNSVYITEWQVFKTLDRLKITAIGFDQLPAWFPRLAATVFAKPFQV